MKWPAATQGCSKKATMADDEDGRGAPRKRQRTAAGQESESDEDGGAEDEHASEEELVEDGIADYWREKNMVSMDGLSTGMD